VVFAASIGVSFAPEQSCAFAAPVAHPPHRHPGVFLTASSDDVYGIWPGGVDFIDKSRRLPMPLKQLRLITDGRRLFGNAEPPAANELVLTSTERPGQENA
jgi:hypothetical protein